MCHFGIRKRTTDPSSYYDSYLALALAYLQIPASGQRIYTFFFVELIIEAGGSWRRWFSNN